MQQLVNALVRPCRFIYSPSDLGSQKSLNHLREDSQITNNRNLNIRYSYYRHRSKSTTCLIYAHCNSGSRVEGLPYVYRAAQLGWNVCIFDFTGSGLSDGQVISLGHFEADDLGTILNECRTRGNSKLLLWGRSMGAATIIYHLGKQKQQHNDIVGCVLDCPYSCLWELALHCGAQMTKLPQFFIETALEYARNTIRNQYGFDIKRMQPKEYVSSIDIPLLYLTSVIDDVVPSQQVQELYHKTHSKNKRLEYIEEAHNSTRSDITMTMCTDFLQRSSENAAHRYLRPYFKQQPKATGEGMAELIFNERARSKAGKLTKIKSVASLKSRGLDCQPAKTVESIGSKGIQLASNFSDKENVCSNNRRTRITRLKTIQCYLQN